MNSLLRAPPAQAVLAAMLAGYLGMALRTKRWTLHGEEHFHPFAAAGPAVFAFWHEFLPLMPALSILARDLPSYRPVPVHTLVSQHRDGRFIGAVVRRFGIMPIYGSSTRGGAAALRSLLAVLKQGDIIGITPDGPQGPRRQAAAGVAQVAALSGAPVLPCAARTSRSIQTNTWDRMPVPLPFGHGVIVCGQPISIQRSSWQRAVPIIEDALNAAARQADKLCRA